MSEIRFEESLEIGDTAIRIFFYEKKGPLNIVYVHLHGDEPGARDAAIEMVNRFGGRVISFLHDNQRYITFTLDGVDYAFDPNRMFSAKGIEASLKREDKYCSIGNFSHQAREQVVGFAQHILIHFFGKPEVVIAPHNNSDGDYHAVLYREGEKFADDAEHVHIVDNTHPGNFFFVIDKEHHEFLTDKGFNSVLQSSSVEDDGSLSVFCLRNGHVYVNCEADEEHIDEQLWMLRSLYGMLIVNFADHIVPEDLTEVQREALQAYDVQAGVSKAEHDVGWRELEQLGLAILWHRNGKVLYARTVAGDKLYRQLSTQP